MTMVHDFGGVSRQGGLGGERCVHERRGALVCEEGREAR